MLSTDEIDAYLAPLTEDQPTCVRVIRKLIVDANPDMVEAIDTGKWFTGLLTYHTTDKIFAFAVGPLSGGFTTLHMMPFYGSSELQARHGEALKRFQSGKSCIKFKTPDQLPLEAVRDIFATGPKFAEIAREMFANRKKR